MIEEQVGSSPGAVRDAARGEVLVRHARLTKQGRPIFCAPSQAEIRGAAIPRQDRGTDGKVIYPTREAAEAAARELEALGARALRAYLCGRSRRGHFHLATDNSVRPLHERIPQQRGAAVGLNAVDGFGRETLGRETLAVVELPPSLRQVEVVIVVDMQSGFRTGEHAVPAARLPLATAREITVERRGAVASEDL